jgi:hypothetical protein
MVAPSESRNESDLVTLTGNTRPEARVAANELSKSADPDRRLADGMPRDRVAGLAGAFSEGHQQGAERKIAWQGPLFRSPPILATCMRFATTAKFFGGSTTRGSPW